MDQPECIFCRIIRHQAEASQIYQDEVLTAFLDIRPVNPGHTLVVPNEHAADLGGLPAPVGGRMFALGQRLAAALRRSGLRCEGVNLYLADGQAAGQEVLHVHLHVLPRFVGDGFGLRRGLAFGQPSRGDLNETAARIRASLTLEDPRHDAPAM
jgi:diadenosine tetraphosphate (Ap4A) HIT family hydrolase